MIRLYGTHGPKIGGEEAKMTSEQLAKQVAKEILQDMVDWDYEEDDAKSYLAAQRDSAKKRLKLLRATYEPILEYQKAHANLKKHLKSLEGNESDIVEKASEGLDYNQFIDFSEFEEWAVNPKAYEFQIRLYEAIVRELA